MDRSEICLNLSIDLPKINASGAYDKADMCSRVLYTNAAAREAERLGWSWGYWQFDSDFIVYNIDQDSWMELILNALFQK